MNRSGLRGWVSIGMAAFATAAVALTAILALSPATGQTSQPTQPTVSAPTTPFDVAITVDASATKGPLKPIYRFFGADEPNYAYMEDGMKLLNDIGKLGPAQTYFRAHNMMTTGDGTPALKWGSTNMYTEDAQGNPVYDWTISDRIIEAYLKNGVKPLMQIGFMPKALSTNPEPYQHTWAPGQPYSNIYTGWSYPPKDFAKWGEVVHQWAKHCVEKYGKEEVEKWYWETWNESNVINPRTGAYWRGTPEEFRKLHDYAIDGVRRALPTAKVGGPHTAGAGGQWMRDFLEHCLRGTNHATGKTGTPIDFIAFHAKGQPRFVDERGQNVNNNSPAGTVGHVRMGISNQLATINSGFQIVASYPELKNTPIIIGESDPDGCAACAATVYPENGYRHTEQFAAYSAAVFARKHMLADRHGVNLEGAVTWAFEFEDQPIWGGYRVMATEGGINVPAFNAFRIMGKMTGQRITATSTGEIPLDEIMRTGVRTAKSDVAAQAAIDGNKVTVMVWHYHDDYIPGADANVSIALKGLPANAGAMKMTHYRVDNTHSNAYTAWQKMGSPKQPTPLQFDALRAAGNLQTLGDPQPVTASNGTAEIKFPLPRQGVSLLELTW